MSQSVTPKSSPSSAYGGSTIMTSPAPEVAAAQDMLETMKSALGILGITFDSLGEQASQVAVMGPALESAQQLNSLRKHMLAHDKKQEEKFLEIKDLLKDVLHNQIVEHLRQRIEEQIADEVEHQVRELVGSQLESHIPAALQEEVVNAKRQLEDVRRALHNSESRRANALLRSGHIHEPLHTIFRSNGEISSLFPADLTSLFALDGLQVKQLMEEYEILDPSESRERNLNRFIQFCGVRYQMVPTNSGAATPT